MKKKNYTRNWNGLLPILMLGHDTMLCIVTGRAWEAAGARSGMLRHGAQARDTALRYCPGRSTRRAVHAAGVWVTILFLYREKRATCGS